MRCEKSKKKTSISDKTLLYYTKPINKLTTDANKFHNESKKILKKNNWDYSKSMDKLTKLESKYHNPKKGRMYPSARLYNEKSGKRLITEFEAPALNKKYPGATIWTDSKNKSINLNWMSKKGAKSKKISDLKREQDLGQEYLKRVAWSQGVGMI